MEDMGRMLILFGVLIVVIGGILLLISRLPGLGLGRLPGDITIQTGNISCFFPIVTSIILSIVLTILVQLAYWLSRR